MAGLLSATQLRNDWKIETDASDDVLDSISNAESVEIQRVSGVNTSRVQTFRLTQNPTTITLAEDAASITSVYINDGADPLDADQYTLYGGRFLRGSFGQFVRVTYVPAKVAETLDHQKMVLAQLVRLYLAYNGYKSVRGPELSLTSYDEYTTERAKLLRSLNTTKHWLFV